jgi:dienelactone hydrolase
MWEATIKLKRSSLAHLLLWLLLISAAALASACASLRRTPTPIAEPASSDGGLHLRQIAVNGLDADFFCDESGGPRRVVITLSGSEGGKWLSDNTSMIRDLLRQGYCVMSLAYFNSDGLPQHLRRIPLEYFETAFQWLAAQEEVVPDDYALLGESRGAELALILGSRYPQVGAVVALVPSYVSFPSPPTGILDALLGQHSSWTYGGQDLPYVPIRVSFDAGKAIITQNWNAVMMRALEDASAVEAATIPVENIQGPMLCISNARDVQWPSTYSCQEIVNRLTDRGFGYFYDHIAYDEPGTHAWCGQPCWQEVLRFLMDRFGQ